MEKSSLYYEKKQRTMHPEFISNENIIIKKMNENILNKNYENLLLVDL